MSKVVIRHRYGNNERLYRLIEQGEVAECDLVEVWGKLYLFHPGGLFTIFMAEPLMWFFRLTWFIWVRYALRYEELLRLSEEMEYPILLELKKVDVGELDELPKSLHHIDTYDLCLAQAIKAKFGVLVSVHLLFTTARGGLILKSPRGYFKWCTWEQLSEVDIITPTYQLSIGWFNPDLWQTVKSASGKIIYLGGGFRGRVYGTLARNFDQALEHVDGSYER